MEYKKGSYVVGCVTGIESYGIFVSLDDYYNGLIHISEITDSYVKDINFFVKIGDTIRAKIVDIDENEHHIKLSIKNINYKNINSKRAKIVETESGFLPLEKKLDGWIKEKISKINEKNVKIDIDK
ncbi:MAG: S1 RNA-binding domain-containing protein [Bacilli bacterium]